MQEWNAELTLRLANADNSFTQEEKCGMRLEEVEQDEQQPSRNEGGGMRDSKRAAELPGFWHVAALLALLAAADDVMSVGPKQAADRELPPCPWWVGGLCPAARLEDSATKEEQ